MKNIITYICLALVVIACNKDAYTPPSVEGDTIVELKPSTILIEDETNISLMDIDSSKLVYSGENEVLQDLKIGDVIISRPTELAPAGYLRKITAIDNSGGNLILETEYADLPDAFDRFKINYNPYVAVNDPTRDAEDIDVTTVDTTLTFELDDINGLPLVFELTLNFEYQIELVTQVDYDFFRTPQISAASFGFRNLKLNDLSISKKFKLGDIEQDLTESHGGILNRLNKRLFLITLNPFPIDPSALIWVQPVVSIDGVTALNFEAAYSTGVALSNSTPGRGLMNYTPAEGFKIDSQLPTDYFMNVNMGLEGTVTLETGLELNVGIAPYTRSLFTTGVGVTNSIVNTLSGSVDADFNTRGEGDFDFTADLDVDLRVKGDIFIDGEFFGFIPEELDYETDVFDNTFDLFNIGTAFNGCSIFKTRSARVNCDANGDLSLLFNASTPSNNVADGRYIIQVRNSTGDTLTVDTPISFNTAQIVDLNSLPIGMYEVEFKNAPIGNTGEILDSDCIVIEDIEIIECNENPGELACGPGNFTTMYGLPYCLFPDGVTGKDWIASNLVYTTIDLGACYDDNVANCQEFGALYTYEEALTVCPSGWRLPTRDEWIDLLSQGNIANITYETDSDDISITGTNDFKDLSTWGNTSGVSNGFNIRPGGFINLSGNSSSNQLYDNAYYWTSDGDPTGAGAYAVFLDQSNVAILSNNNTKDTRLSCRCIQD